MNVHTFPIEEQGPLKVISIFLGASKLKMESFKGGLTLFPSRRPSISESEVW